MCVCMCVYVSPPNADELRFTQVSLAPVFTGPQLLKSNATIETLRASLLTYNAIIRFSGLPVSDRTVSCICAYNKR